MPRWFISHATRDRAFVEGELLDLLESLDEEVWYAPDDIPPASYWECSLRDGLQECDWFLLVLSPASAESEWVQRETAWALEHRRGRIIPVTIAPCPAGAFHRDLPGIQHIDLSADPKQGRKHLMRLVLSLQKGRAIAGQWRGTLSPHRPVEGLPAALPFDVALSVQSSRVTGTGRLTDPAYRPLVGTDYRLNGVVHYSRFLQLDYVSAMPGRIQFGSVVLEIDNTGDRMAGKLAGFGAVSQAIVTADVELTKQADEPLTAAG